MNIPSPPPPPPPSPRPEHRPPQRPRPATPSRPEIPRPDALVALAIAVIAAIAIPGSRAGIGLAIVGMLVVYAGARALPARDSWRIACLILATALALMPLLRDANWLLVLDLGAALALCATAVVGARTWRGLLRAPFALAGVTPAGPFAVVRGTRFKPGDVSVAIDNGAAAIRGIAIGGGLVVVFGALFASADGAFAQLIGEVTPNPGVISDLPWRILAGLGAGGVAGGLAMVALQGDRSQPVEAPRRSLAPIEWTIALSALAALFVAFVAVQFIVLFGGRTHVLTTAGLTYADYAHSGFAQLLIAAALVLAVVGAARRWAVVDSPRSAFLLRALLALLCACTLVIVASALHRLDIYVDAFGATRLRVLAASVCVLVGAAVALTLAANVYGRYAWVPRAFVVAAGVGALALSFANPDAWIASRNVDRYVHTGNFDADYAAGLSADATPELSRLPDELRDRVLGEQLQRLATADGPFGFNVARERARDELTSP